MPRTGSLVERAGRCRRPVNSGRRRGDLGPAEHRRDESARPALLRGSPKKLRRAEARLKRIRKVTSRKPSGWRVGCQAPAPSPSGACISAEASMQVLRTNAA